MPAEEKIIGKDSSKFAKALNLSYGGALLRTTANLQRGQTIGLNIHLPLFPQPVSVKARVIWVQSVFDESKTFDIGLEYLNISHSDKEKLTETLSSMLDESKSQPEGKPGGEIRRL